MKSLSDVSVNIKLKLSALWASTVFCYIYCDYFELYTPGKLDDILKGIGPIGSVTQGTMLAASVLLIIPSLMVFLCVALPAQLGRMINIVFGVLFTALMAFLAYVAGWYFYKLFAATEALLTALVVWYAWHWPRVEKDA